MTRRDLPVMGAAAAGVVLIGIVLHAIFSGKSSGGLNGAGAAATSGDHRAQSRMDAASTEQGDTTILPAEYSILQARNAFGRGRGHGRSAGGPEAAFVFEGAVQAGSRFTAFVENVPAINIQQVAVGDSLARGRVKSIDLDAIEYVSSGRTRRIEVGQNLNGEAAPPPPPTSRPAPPPAPGPPGPPPSGGPPQPPNGPPPGMMVNKD